MSTQPRREGAAASRDFAPRARWQQNPQTGHYACAGWNSPQETIRRAAQKVQGLRGHCRNDVPFASFAKMVSARHVLIGDRSCITTMRALGKFMLKVGSSNRLPKRLHTWNDVGLDWVFVWHR